MRRGVPAVLGRLALVVGSVVFSLFVLEIGWRVLQSGPQALVDWPNLAGVHMGNSGNNTRCAFRHDARLGWTLPPASCSSPGFTIDPQGFRSAPSDVRSVEPPILAVGASFALGEEVADDETWPAALQARTGRRVVNAGVSGYALDQTVLYAEQLVPSLKPSLVLVSFTPGDVRRTELKVAWSRNKPFFRLAGDDLHLENVPVPVQPEGSAALPTAARLLGRSALANEIVQRLGVQRGWYFDEEQGSPPGTGEAIACRLVARLAALSVPMLMVAQYPRWYWSPDTAATAWLTSAASHTLACGVRAGLPVLDLAPALRSAIEVEGLEALYRRDHHSARGNRLVADILDRELLHLGLLPPTGQ